MPLSPFRARLAILAFLAIWAAIGANLLMMQTPRSAANSAVARRSEPWSVPTLVDADQLGRKALEALIGSHLVREAPGPDRRSPPPKTNDGKRIGSFAPSSGSFAQIALPGGDPEQIRKATVRSVQAELQKRGYEPGGTDGIVGLVTRASVMAYEHDQGLPLTADPTPEILAHLRHGTSAPGAAIGLDPSAPRSTGQAEQLIRTVQQALRQLGYMASRPDGSVSDETIRAIREFEMDSGLVPTGRISGSLVARLMKQASARQGR